MELKDLDKVICGYLSEAGVKSSRCHFFIRGDEEENYLVCDVAGEMDTLAVAMTTAMAHDYNVEIFIRRALAYLDEYKKSKGELN